LLVDKAQCIYFFKFYKENIFLLIIFAGKYEAVFQKTILKRKSGFFPGDRILSKKPQMFWNTILNLLNRYN